MKNIILIVAVLTLTACAGTTDLTSRVDALDARVKNQQEQINTLSTKVENVENTANMALDTARNTNTKLDRVFEKAMYK